MLNLITASIITILHTVSTATTSITSTLLAAKQTYSDAVTMCVYLL
jgi:hypothetical protein